MRRSGRLFTVAGLAAAAALVVASCGRQTTQAVRSPAPTPQATVTVHVPVAERAKVLAASLRRFPDCTSITTSLRADALRYVGPFGLVGSAPVMYLSGESRPGVPAQAGAATAGGAAEKQAAPQAGVDYSQTNVQEAGVDEPDSVKTDGRRIFTVEGSVLRSAVISSGVVHLAGKLDLKRYVFGLLLSGDKLVALEGDQAVPVMGGAMRPIGGGGMPYAPVGGKTVVEVLDVSDPTAMRIGATLRVDGSYVAARSVGGIARLVLNRPQPDITFVTPKDGTKQAVDGATAANKAAIGKATVAQWIPRYELSRGNRTSSGDISSCTNTYRPASFSGLGTVTVVTIDPSNPTPKEGSTVVGGGDIVYSSSSALYVTTIKQPEPIPYPAPGQPAPAYTYVPPQTAIHKFDITGTAARYVASGLVDGTLLNQFAMSELGGNLRVATTSQSAIVSPGAVTSSGPGVPNTSSGVTVLAQSGGALVGVGHIGGLGGGETIRGVRFIGPAAYVVTFRQIDPLFVVDLSDPAKPKVAGKLEMPGYSAYLHPIGDGLILGVGEQADAQGHVHDDQGHWFGAKVSLFDVHDPSHPKEVSTFKVTEGTSPAEFDHHAFLWWGPWKLAVLPVQSMGFGDQSSNFVGALALTVEPSKPITELRRISHPASQQNGSQSPAIERSLVASDRLLTFSADGILVTDIHTSKDVWVAYM